MPEDRPKAKGEQEPIQGGPEPDQAPPPEPQGVKVKIGTQEFLLPPEAARAFTDYDQATQQKFGRLGSELDELRRRPSPPPPAPPKPAEPDLNVLWFENPPAAADLIVNKVVEQVRGEYQRDQGLRQFWTDFYREHDDLREDDFLVRAVFQEHYEALSPLKVREARSKLADLTRQEVLRLARKAKPAADQGDGRAKFESPSAERAPRPSAAEEDEAKGPQSLSDVIRQRARARRAAAQKQQAVAGGPGA